jgi:Na+/proline symporter
MSTIGTQLNWGTSYLVNDFYRRFLVRNAGERHYVNIGKVFTVLLVLAGGYVASQLASISEGWQIVLGIGAGTSRFDFALVLVAHQCVERNQRNGYRRGADVCAGQD